MRHLLAILTLSLVPGCQLFAPGQTEFRTALHMLEDASRENVRSAEYLSPDELATVHRHLDAAIEREHPGAMQLKAHVVWQTDGLLASEPYWRQLARVDDKAWGMVAYLASIRPRLEAGTHARDLPPGHQLDGLDTEAEIAVLREGAAAGSATADSLLRARLDVLHRQRAAGNADADSLLALLDA